MGCKRKSSTSSGLLIAAVGFVFLLGAAVSPMPDALGGWLFGGVFMLAAFTSLNRSAYESQANTPQPENPTSTPCSNETNTSAGEDWIAQEFTLNGA